MKKIKSISALLVLINCIFLIGSMAYSQQKIPKENIPSNIPPDIRKEIEKLYLSSAIDRVKAIVAIGKLGIRATSAIPFLISILDDGTPLYYSTLAEGSDSFMWMCGICLETTPSKIAAQALVNIGKPAIDPLITVMRNKSENSLVRENAAYALGMLGNTNAVDPLLAIIKEGNDCSRADAIEAMGKMKEKRVTEPLLVSALNDKFWLVRENAAYALGMLGNTNAVDPLLAIIKDSKSFVLSGISQSCGLNITERIINATPYKYLIPKVRARAADALAETKDTRAIEPLIDTLKDDDKIVRKAAADALKKITGKSFGVDPIKWQKWWEKNKKK